MCVFTCVYAWYKKAVLALQIIVCHFFKRVDCYLTVFYVILMIIMVHSDAKSYVLIAA